MNFLRILITVMSGMSLAKVFISPTPESATEFGFWSFIRIVIIKSLDDIDKQKNKKPG